MPEGWGFTGWKCKKGTFSKTNEKAKQSLTSIHATLAHNSIIHQTARFIYPAHFGFRVFPRSHETTDS
jgi:hypothetical protein